VGLTSGHVRGFESELRKMSPEFPIG